MARLIFNAADVRRVVEHSLAAPAQGKKIHDYDSAKGELVYRDVAEPAVLLVHDSGVYLMSNGEPRDKLPDSQSSFCAYAHGCNPDTDDDWYDTARDLVGGDDFGETLECARELKRHLDTGAEHIAMELTADSISIETWGRR